MSSRVFRSINEPIRENPSFEERLRGPDKGLIIAWEVGRQKSIELPELAEKAKKGELPKLGYKGGIDKETKQNIKGGTLNYLAQWQGLKGEDLEIDLTKEKRLVCSKTKVEVRFSPDIQTVLNYKNEEA